MNIRIKTIKEFLNNYRTLDSYWRILLEDSYKYYVSELMNEYNKVSEHPYPEEYKEYQKNLNNYKNDMNIAI